MIPDFILHQATRERLQVAKLLLDELDQPIGEVRVRASMFEVQTTESKGSAFQLIGSLLSSHLGISFGDGTQYPNSIQITFKDAESVFSAFSSDSRFHVVSSPSVRVKSGAKARFVVGSDVPVLGSVSYQDDSRDGITLRSMPAPNSGAM